MNEGGAWGAGQGEYGQQLGSYGSSGGSHGDWSHGSSSGYHQEAPSWRRGPQFESGGSGSGGAGQQGHGGQSGYGGMGQGYGASRAQGRPPRAYKRSDERVREDVYERLSQAGVDASEVVVDVRDGRVTLSGTVPDRWMKHHIEDLADNCSGVQDVENQIRVQRGESSYGQQGGMGSSNMSGSSGQSSMGSGGTT